MGYTTWLWEASPSLFTAGPDTPRISLSGSRSRRENAQRIVAALDDFGFASFGLRAEDFTNPDSMIQLGYEPNRVDFLTKLDGVEFADAYPMRVSLRIGELDIPVIDRASLIANKRALGRPHDLDDAKDLEK